MPTAPSWRSRRSRIGSGYGAGTAASPPGSNAASSGGSKALERIPTAIVPRQFAPGFKVQLMNKDLETFNTIARELHVPVSFSNVAQRYQQAALAAGLGEQDTSVVVTIIEQLAALKR